MATATLDLLDEPDRLRSALSPVRRQLLERVNARPASATELAAEMDLSRQRVNYHLRALEAAGLLELVEERQRRGCIERVLQTSADALVVDPSVLAHPADRATAQDRFAAEHLVDVAAGTVRDVARMQAQAGREGTRLLTFTIEAEVAFAVPGDLERFTDALTNAVRATTDEFHHPGGRRYRILAAGHPAPATDTPQETPQ